MKPIVFIRVFLVVLAVFPACENENEKEEILYPAGGNFGENLLQTDSIAVIASSDWGGSVTYYSIRAELPENTSVKLIFKYNTAQSDCVHFLEYTRQGWSMDYVITEERSGTVHLYGYGQVVCEIKVYFTYSGTAEIEIYENDKTIPSRIKTFSWKI
jgi:hypothetical protein